MYKINELMNAFIEWKGVTNLTDLYIILAACIAGMLVCIKMLIDYYQDVIYPTSFGDFVRYVTVNKDGRTMTQVKIVIHNYLLLKTYYTFNLGAVYSDQVEAENALLHDDSFLDTVDDFIANRVFKLRLLKQIETQQI